MKIVTALILCAMLCTAAAAAEDAPGLEGRLPMDEVLELARDGWIDWTAGRVYAWGRTLVTQPGEVEGVDGHPRLAAAISARERMVSLLRDLRLDADITLSQGEGREELMTSLAEGGRIVQERNRRGRYLEVRLEVQLHGRHGLAGALLGAVDYEEPQPEEPRAKKKRKKRKEEGGPTGVIIDARGTGLRPAYLPRVLAPDGTVLWSLEQAQPFTQRSRGLAAYGRIRKVTGPEPTETQWMAHPVLSRMGRRPAILRARAAKGALLADVVLEPEDAERLSGSEDLRRLLSRAHLVIVVD